MILVGDNAHIGVPMRERIFNEIRARVYIIFYTAAYTYVSRYYTRGCRRGGVFPGVILVLRKLRMYGIGKPWARGL